MRSSVIDSLFENWMYRRLLWRYICSWSARHASACSNSWNYTNACAFWISMSTFSIVPYYFKIRLRSLSVESVGSPRTNRTLLCLYLSLRKLSSMVLGCKSRDIRLAPLSLISDSLPHPHLASSLSNYYTEGTAHCT